MLVILKAPTLAPKSCATEIVLGRGIPSPTYGLHRLRFKTSLAQQGARYVAIILRYNGGR